MMPPEHASARLARLLALITYLQEHPAVRVADVATHFQVTEAQVLEDVNLLWVSGTPGYLPDDLIDFSCDAYERGVLTLTDSRGMHRPLRLSPSEAIALVAALRALAAGPGLPGGAVVASAAAKLAAAAGDAAATALAVDVRLALPPRGDLVADLRGAIRDNRRVHVRYVSAADVVSERDVDPLELLTDGARWFLRAWCHRARDVRHFRLDRVLAMHVMPVPADAHPESGGWGAASDAAPDLATASLSVTLEIAPHARWVAEGLPVDSVTELGDGWLAVCLKVASSEWLRGLVLGLGPDVRAVAPAWLARDIARVAAAALAAYDQPVDAPTAPRSPTG